MSGPEQLCNVAIVPGTLILIADKQGDGRTRGLPFKNSGEDLYGVSLVSLCCVFTLTGSAPVEELLDLFC